MATGINILFISLFCLMFVGAGIHIACLKKDRSAKHILGVLLIWVLALAGVVGAVKFYGHIFQPNLYADFLGWSPGTAWQYDTAVINLLISVLGFLSIWIHGSFWTATVIALAIRDWGSAFGHYLQLIRHFDVAMGNIGIFVTLEILHPILAIILLIAYNNVKQFPQKL